MTENPTTDHRPTVDEMLLALNDIHSRALAARLGGGDDGSLMLEIEELAEDMLERSCEEAAHDTNFE
jgi:hypothetical protein